VKEPGSYGSARNRFAVRNRLAPNRNVKTADCTSAAASSPDYCSSRSFRRSAKEADCTPAAANSRDWCCLVSFRWNSVANCKNGRYWNCWADCYCSLASRAARTGHWPRSWTANSRVPTADDSRLPAPFALAHWRGDSHLAAPFAPADLRDDSSFRTRWVPGRDQ
jgi:hypothetical protein